MTTAAQPVSTPAPSSLADLANLPEWRGAVALIEYRDHPEALYQEFSGGVDGPDPFDLVRALCRTLPCWPSDLTFEFDPKKGDGRPGVGAAAQAYAVLDGRRVARVQGCSFAWLNVAASALANRGWRPGRNREVVDPAGWERRS